MKVLPYTGDPTAITIRNDVGRTCSLQESEQKELLKWFKENKPELVEILDADIAKAALYDCIRPEIRRMAHQMEQKFRLHDRDRGDPFREIPEMSLEWLEQREQEERMEFLVASGLFKPDYFTGEKPPSIIWRELADRCNFNVMMAIKYERSWKCQK